MLMPIIIPPVGYKTTAVTFDGINDYMLRGSDLTGDVDGKKGIISLWIKLEANLTTLPYYLIQSNGGFFALYIDDTTKKIQFSALNSSSTVLINVASSSAYSTSDGWLHILISWDLNTPVIYLYVNNSNRLATTTLTAGTIDYTRTNYSIGAGITGSSKMNADAAEWYVNFADALDLSSSSNRAKFINQSSLKPVNLGADGSLPTGTVPIIYQRCAVGAAASSFANNSGSGGNFSITGALTTAATSPSD